MIYKRYEGVDRKSLVYDIFVAIVLLLLGVWGFLNFEQIDLPQFMKYNFLFLFIACPRSICNARFALMERFYISGDVLVATKKGEDRRIELPNKMIVVIGNGRNLKKKVDYTNRMEEEFNLSLLDGIDVASAIQLIDAKGRYNGSEIEALFKNHGFLYSFTYRAELVETIARGRTCILIGPEYFKGIIEIDYSCFSGVIWDNYLFPEVLEYKMLSVKEAIVFIKKIIGKKVHK